MIKIKLLLALLVFPALVVCQTSHFENVAIASPSFKTNKSAQQIYRALSQLLYKRTSGHPESVITASKENDYITFTGSVWNVFQKQTLWDTSPKYNANYVLSVTIKDSVYTMRYTHDEFTDHNMEPVAFDLNSVLNGYCGYLGPDAPGSYEFRINQLFESISYFIETGTTIKRSPILEDHPKMFMFNADGSSNIVTYHVDMTWEQLLNGIQSWAHKNIADPEKIMTVSAADKTVKIEFRAWDVFEKSLI